MKARPRRPSLLLFCACGILLAAPRTAWPDRVLVANDDRLSGAVLRQERSRLRLETTYAGTLDIAWKDVREIHFDEPGRVLLDDDTVLDVAAVLREDERLTLRREGPNSAVSIDASRLKLIQPEGWELGQGRKLEAQVNVALKSEKGNSESSDFDLDFAARRRWRWHTLTTYGAVEYDTTRGIDSSDNWTWMSSYNRLLRSRWYGSTFTYFKHDRFADLRLRFLAGPAAGTNPRSDGKCLGLASRACTVEPLGPCSIALED